MRPLARIVFACAFLSLAATGTALGQDANKVIDQYLKAAGGSKAIARIQTLAMDGAFSSGPEEKPGTFTLRVKQPNRFYTEIQSDGKPLIESYNGKSAWHQTETGEIGTLLGPQALEMEAAAEYCNTRLEGLAKKKIGVALQGARAGARPGRAGGAAHLSDRRAVGSLL